MLSVRWPLSAILLTFAALSAVASASAGAQSSCAPASRALNAVSEDVPQVLRRKVTLSIPEIALREALDRIAAAAKVRVSYSAEMLPLSRSVCLNYESATLASVLADLLEGFSIKPVVVGSDQIVLAPADAAAATGRATKPAGLTKHVGQLDRVVVTGSVTGASERSLPIALDVITDRQLSQRGTSSFSRMLDGVVPGLWIWEQSPVNLLARYGSVRGASSFGVSYPKVYVDGIEVANSLLVTHLDPDAVSRIEIIRGPQGAALYGADAISGVMNIIMRQGTEKGTLRAEILTRGGASASDYARGSVLAQTHAASFGTGNTVRSARLGATLSRIGAFVPDAFSQQFTTSAGMRLTGSRAVVSGTFRLFAQDAQAPPSPLLADIGQPTGAPASITTGDSSGRQSVRQYTLGGSAIFAQSDKWTHSATLGLDGYRLTSAAIPDDAFASPIDSALHAATGSAIRSTVRLSSTAQIGNPEEVSGTLTLAAEHSFICDRTRAESGFSNSESGHAAASLLLAETRSNAGLIAQLGAGYHDILHLSGGVRVERNTGLDGIGEIAILPMLGIAAVQSIGGATLKLRSAYGRGIRAPETSTRARMLLLPRGASFGAGLSPEEQSGIEVGADLFLGRSLTLHATRFDQTASGLIQPVSIRPVAVNDDALHRQYVAYELQNVGVITNRGWEFAGRATVGPWFAGGTFSQVDSRVRRLAARYTGDLRPGDRMLEVPARTIGASAGYERGRWSTSWSLARASDWINYDRLAMLHALRNQSHDVGNFVGPQLRSWWRTYDGVSRIGGRVALAATRGMTLTLEGENLLDEQRGEPDNITVIPGRTLSAGVRLGF